MYHRELSEQAIISGFRKGDANIIREYFYGYCQAGYYIFDQRYQLSEKENLDFMSLAHQYAIYLMEHDWKPLEDHSPNVSLKTWLINGFRYVVLDALKWYKKEYGSITFEDYLRSFDVTSDLRLQFNRMVEDVCDHAPLDRQERLLIDMLLLRGFKGKEIAAQMGMTPSTVFQEELRHGLGHGGGDGRAGNCQSRGYDGRGFDACTHNARLFGRHVCTKVVRGYGFHKRRGYGTEKNNTRVYYFVGAERDLCIRQQFERYARRRCCIYRIPQVRSHHGSGRGSARPELCHPNDAGRCGNWMNSSGLPSSIPN